MHSMPLRPSKKFLLCKSTKKARYVRSLGKKTHFGAFPEAKKGVVICAMLRTGPIIMQIPRGYQRKSSLCRKSAILSIRWKFPFCEGWGGSLKKVLILVQRPQHKSTPDPVAAPKYIPFGTIFIEFGDTKKCCTFSVLELAPKSRKKLIGALSCMHKTPKCIQSLWDHTKKILFVQKYKESAICAILRGKNPILGTSQRLKKLTGALSCMHKGPKSIQSLWDYLKKLLFLKSTKKARYVRSVGKKPHFGAFPEAKKGVVICAMLRTGPIIMQISRGYQKKKFIV